MNTIIRSQIIFELIRDFFRQISGFSVFPTPFDNFDLLVTGKSLTKRHLLYVMCGYNNYQNFKHFIFGVRFWAQCKTSILAPRIVIKAGRTTEKIILFIVYIHASEIYIWAFMNDAKNGFKSIIQASLV